MAKRLLAAMVLGAMLALPARGELVSEVRPLPGSGVPALYVNGELHTQVWAAPYRAGANNVADFQDFTAAGIDTYNIYLRFPWTGEETYDFGPVNAKMDALLAANPRARFVPRVLLTPGRWFAEKYPDEISRRDDGSPAGMFPSQNAGNNPSFSSDVYRRLSRKAMEAFIRHVEGKYGDHIVGYQVGNGFGGEWLPFNSFWEIRPGGTPPEKFGVEDYSPAALAHFRRWLGAKYQTDAALQAAWKHPAVTLATATIPDEKERYTTTRGIFFDPAVSLRCPDWFAFYNESVADVLLENAAWVKELTGRRKIVGAFYGYLWCNFPNLSAVHSGQLALTKVLRSPDVDFIASCYTYDNKQIGGPNNSQSLPAAIALHGKLYFNEVDTETHLKQRQWRWGESLNNPKTFEETKALLVRDFAYTLTTGQGMWWTDLHGGTFNDAQIVGLLKQLKEIDDKHRGQRPGSNAEIAVVLDEGSFTFTGDGEPLWNALLTAQKQWHFAFIGAPWDCHLLSDVAGNTAGLRDYKFYIFLNTFRVSRAQRDAIHAKLKRNNATALWVYAPGYIGGDKCSVEYASALTGIRLGEDSTAGELHVQRASPRPELSIAMNYGTDVNVREIIRYYDHQIYLKDPRDPSLRRDLPGFSIAPRFFAADPAAESLGTLPGSDRPGLVRKRQEGWTSIYSAAPLMPAWLVAGFASQAGCHLYSTGDNVYANDRFLGIYSKGGERTIKLPKRATVVNLLDGRTLATGATEFPYTFKENETLLLRLEPAD